jgi:RNA-directed DNA polymerase
MNEKRRKKRKEQGPGSSPTPDPQPRLPFAPGPAGEARPAPGERVEAFASPRGHQSPTSPPTGMQEVPDPENLEMALAKVCGNKGSPGVDGMTAEQLPGYLAAHRPQVRRQLLGGAYKPQPARREQIPKPDGGVRELGIPTVLDRFVQQAVQRVLSRRWDPTFSQSGFGSRPGRSAHQAVEAARRHIAAGREWVVDLDLEKFFDHVNHDRLMAEVMRRESDGALVRLIRSFLTAGVMEDGLVSPTEEGTPQGGPLSPPTIVQNAL